MSALGRAHGTAQDPYGISALQAQLDTAIADRNADVAALVLDEKVPLRTVAGMVQFGLSHEQVRKIAAREQARRDSEWGNVIVRMTPAERLRAAREAFALARHAQQVRCENYALGYAAEEKAFYGDESVAQSDAAERRVTWQGFHEGLAREHDRYVTA